MKTDTIAAIATGMSNSGIGIIRISGTDAVEVADKLRDICEKGIPDYEELANIKSKFANVLEGESKLMKLDEENFKVTINYMLELAENTGDSTVIKTTRNVTKNMKMMSSIFINKNGNVVQNSRLVSALKFKDKMVNILDAIEEVTILKERGQGNVDPRSWRCF